VAHDEPRLAPTALAEGPLNGFTDEERESGMRWIIWDGVLAFSMSVLNSGVFLTGFALMLGASQTLVGFLSSLPRFAALMQPLGSYFVERLRSRKGISVWVFGPARLLWLLVAFLPLMGYHGGKSAAALKLLCLVTAVYWLMAGFASVSWLAWMADLVPERVRGAYFGKRTMISGGVSALVGLLAGRLADNWKAEYGAGAPGGLLIIFGIAVACGLASWYALVRCPEPPLAAEHGDAPATRYLALVRESVADPNFRSFLWFSMVVSVGVWVAAPYFNVYMIKVMHLPYSLMSLFVAVSSLGSLAMVRLWGRLADHFGAKPVMSACLSGISVTPVLWLLSAGGAWWPLLVANVVGGAAWSGYFLAQMNLLFKITPDTRKSVYIGVFYALDALPTLVAPLLGGLFLQHTEHWALHMGSWTLVSYHVVFLASGLTRSMASPILRRIQEPEAKGVRHMVRVLSHIPSVNPVLGVQYYSQVMMEAAGERTRWATRRAARALKHAQLRLRGR
jgi:MFS family permease